MTGGAGYAPHQYSRLGVGSYMTLLNFRTISIRRGAASRIGLGVAFGLMVGLPTIAGAPSTARALSLDEAVAIAVGGHPRVFGAKAAEEVAADTVDVERATYFPEINAFAGSGYVRTDNPGTADRANRGDKSAAVEVLPRTDASVRLTQRIFDGFETLSRTRSAEHVAESAGFDVRDAAEDIAVRAVQAYINVLRDRDIILLGEANVAKHREVHGKVTERFESGAGTEVDVFQADSRLALAENRLREQRSNLRISETDYLEAVGQMPEDLDVPATPAGAVPATEEDGVQTAWDNNPEIKSAAAIVESRRDDIDVARSPYWPTLNLEVSHTWDKDADPNARGIGNTTEVILRLRYNLYRGGADKARTARAKERASQTLQREFEIRRLIEERMRVDYNELSVARDQVPIIEQRVMATERVLEGYTEQFELGLRSLLDVLDVENELFTARISLVEAEYRYTFAHYQLLSDAGMLLNTVGVEPPQASVPFEEEAMASQ